MIAKKSFFFIFIIKSEDLQASSIQLFNFILRQTKTNFIINRLNLTQKKYIYFLLDYSTLKKSCFVPNFGCKMQRKTLNAQWSKISKSLSSNRNSAAFVTKAKLWKSHIIMHVCVFFSRHIWGNWQLSLLNTTTLLALLGNLNNCLLLVSLHFADIFKTCHHQSILTVKY